MNPISVVYIAIFSLVLTSGKDLTESCVHDNGKVVRCKCIGNEEFSLPLNFNFENLTSLLITSCTSVNIYSLSLGNAKLIRDIVIQNVSEKLTFEPLVLSKRIGIFQLNNIKKIPIIDHDTFISISSIESFIIENTRIDNFDEQFANINIESFILRNVTINRIVGINFSNQGKTLRIINSIINNVDGRLNFAFFTTVEIVNSTFEFSNPGDMEIQGYNAQIVGCVFTNVSMNLVAREYVKIKGNCADGKSSLRISSTYVDSHDNKVPTEIIYTRPGTSPESFRNENNTVCIAGNCKCPKSTGHNSHYRFYANIYLGIVLLIIVYGF